MQTNHNTTISRQGNWFENVCKMTASLSRARGVNNSGKELKLCLSSQPSHFRCAPAKDCVTGSRAGTGSFTYACCRIKGCVLLKIVVGTAKIPYQYRKHNKTLVIQSHQLKRREYDESSMPYLYNCCYVGRCKRLGHGNVISSNEK